MDFIMAPAYGSQLFMTTTRILLLRFDTLHCIRHLNPTQALHGQQYQSFSLMQILHAVHQEKTQNLIADFRDLSVVSYLELNNFLGVISGNCVYL